MSKISDSISQKKNEMTNEEAIILKNVVEKLIEMEYTEKNARDLASRLTGSSPIRKSLLHWIGTGEYAECFYEEISALTLMRERGFTYPNALSVIGWLHREPETAREALSEGACIYVE